MRRDLESLKERLSALARHIEETDGVLTEAQVCVLEKKQDDEWLLARLKRLILAILVSGHLLCRDNQRVGRIYQQTFVDTCYKYNWLRPAVYDQDPDYRRRSTQ